MRDAFVHVEAVLVGRCNRLLVQVVGCGVVALPAPQGGQAEEAEQHITALPCRAAACWKARCSQASIKNALGWTR